jgi:hypothetical protein
MAVPTAEAPALPGGLFGELASPTAAAAVQWTPQQYMQHMQQQFMQQQFMQHMQQQFPGQHHGGQPSISVRDHEIDQMILREEMQQETAKKIKAVEKEAAEELLNKQRLDQLKSLRSPK